MTIHQADRLPSDIRGYHQRTKHAPTRYALGPAFLDWTSQPSPYRSLRGRADRSCCRFSGWRRRRRFQDQRPRPRRSTAALWACFSNSPLASAPGRASRARPGRCATIPPRGNLHPTEAYALLDALDGLSDGAALYHYAPLEHALETRATFARAQTLPEGGFLLGAHRRSVARGLEIWRARLSLLPARRGPRDRRGGSGRGGARLARACPSAEPVRR